MSDETYGLMLSAFMLAYTVMNGVSGPLLDRLGTRLGYALCMAWWSTAGLLHALAVGPDHAWACFAFCWAWARRATGRPPSRWWPNGFPSASGRWPRAFSTAGRPWAAIVAPPLVAWLVLRLRLAARLSSLVGVSGYLWLTGWWLVYYTPPHVRREATARPATPWRLLAHAVPVHA